LQVNLSEALKLLEKQLSSSFKLESLPYLVSVQKRLGIYRELQSCVVHERKLFKVVERTRKWSEHALSSVEHPSLAAVAAFTDFGIELFDFLPALIDSVVQNNQSNPTNQRALIPIVRLCQKFDQFPNLSFFDSWSPRVQPPLKKIDLSTAVATSPEGEPKFAIDGNAETAWVSNGGYWTVKLSEAIDLDWLKISWISPFQQKQHQSVMNSTSSETLKEVDKLFEVGAPERLAIFVRFHAVDPKTGSIDETKPVRVKTIEPEKEKSLQGSWVQFYELRLKNVKSIKLIPSKKLCSISTSKNCSIYDLSCYHQDHISWIDNIVLFRKIQQSFLMALQISALQSTILSTHLNLLRCTGSLNLILSFVQFLFEHESTGTFNSRLINDLLGDDYSQKTNGSMEISNSEIDGNRSSYCQLINAILGKEEELKTLYNSENCLFKENQLPSITFSNQKKSSNITVLNKVELQISDWEKGYCVLDFPLTAGVTCEWEFELLPALKESASNELKDPDLKGLRLGLVEMKSPDLTLTEVESFCFMIDLEDGKVYEKSTYSGRQIHFSAVNPRTKYLFTYDGLANQLKLHCGTDECGVLFEQVPTASMFPVIFFNPRIAENSNEKRPNQTIRLSCCNVIKNPKSNVSSLERTQSTKITLESISTISEYAEKLLHGITSLAETLFLCIQSSVNFSKKVLSGNLEYPFCLEISLDVFKKSTIILEFLFNDGSDSKNLAIKSILTILELQFTVFNQSKMKLQSIESYITESNVDSTTIQLSIESLADSLKQRLSDSSTTNDDIRSFITITYARGLKLFQPNSLERTAEILELLNKKSLHQQLSKYYLADILLQTLIDFESVSDLITQMNASSSDLIALLSLVLDFVSEIEKEKVRLTKDKLSAEQENFLQTAAGFLKILFEEAAQNIISSTTKNPVDESMMQIRLIVHLVREFFAHSLDFLRFANLEISNWISEWDFDLFLQKCLLSSLIHPILYSLTLENLPINVIELLAEEVQSFAIAVSQLASTSKICSETLNLVSSSIPRRNGKGGNGGSGGWKTLKVVFEDSDSSFSVSDNGTTYTSLHSSNTCALVNYRFTTAQRAAWEFVLDVDSFSDECSVFGAARQPLRSRCYSSSNDLWMRRSYNGYMYCQGNTTGTNMEKIHPGDTVRIEWNGPEGTLSFSVNGGEMEVGFTDIVDDVYPSCGSYRNGVVIKLLKVEIYNTAGSLEDENIVEDHIPAKTVWWSLPETLTNIRDSSLLQHLAQKDKSKNKKITPKWLTARASKGALHGVHDWEFQFNDNLDGPWSVGFVVDYTPVENRRLASVKPDKKDSEFHYCAWNSDGSLWVDEKMICTSFGTGSFPFRKFTTVKLRINRTDGTVSFFVNGEFIGVACGPSSFNPIYSVSLPDESSGKVIYPAASVYSQHISIKIKAGGMETSAAIPLLNSLSHSSISVLGRIAARLIQGTEIDPNEKGLLEWLRSAIFSGGIDSIFLDASKLEALPLNSLSELQSKISEVVSDDVFKRDILPSEKFLLEIAHGYNLEVEDSPVAKLYEWLEKIDAEPLPMRKALEKNDNYRFSSCELPFIACLLKHAGMMEEAYLASQSLTNNSVPPPSEEMFLLWQKVKQLRTNLRRKKQQLRAKNVESEQSVLNLNSEVSKSEGGKEVDKSENMDAVPNNTFKTPAQEIDARFGHSSFGFCESLNWKTQPEWTVVNEKESVTARIKYISVDLPSFCLYIYLELTAPPDRKLCSFTDCSISVGEFEVDEYILIDHEVMSNTGSALLWFDLSDNDTVKLPDVEKFSFRVAPGWESIQVSLSKILDSDKGKDCPASTLEFSGYCNSIAAKSQFLLLMKSAWSSFDSTSKTTLLGLSSMYAGGISLKRKEESMRQKTEDRWRRVIEFLHVSSKIKKQLSFETSSYKSIVEQNGGDNENDSTIQETDEFELDNNPFLSPSRLYLASKEDISTAQAAIQACSIFVNSEDSVCSAENLCKLMKTRLRRANMRIHALKLLKSVLVNQCVAHDPILVFHLLVIVKNCIPPVNFSDSKNPDSQQERAHYLLNLEGCSAAILKSVQTAFASLYNALADSFNYYFQIWDHASSETMKNPLQTYQFNLLPPPHLVFQALLMVLKMWTIQFSSRDYGWIVDSSILPVLFKIISFSSQEKIIHQWYSIASQLVNFNIQDGKTEDIPSIKLLNKDTVSEGLKNGNLCGRSLLFHLCQFVSCEKYSEADRKALGLDKPFDEVYDYINVIETSTKIFSELSLVHNAKSESVEFAKKQEAAAKEAEEAKRLKEELKRLSPMGILDSDHQAKEVKVSEFNSVATLREDRSGTSVCVYCTVDYNLNHPGDHGNYFEVTVLSVGQGDVGIGFADKRVFGVTDNMPGWVTHSYGYHGDDGKKYGNHLTPGDFPTFEEGDVIGCGIKFDTKTIFYTRNGSLLGDGFTEIDETIVTPILGFSNRHDDTVKVKINFGVEPFVYAGEEVIVNAKALEERVKRDSEASVKVVNSSASGKGLPFTTDVAEEDNNGDSELSTETKALETEPKNYKTLHLSLKAVDAQLYEYSVLRNSALELVRYFLFLSSETRQQSSSNKISALEKGHTSRNTPHTGLTSLPEGFQKPKLLKEVSAFGTPSAVTKPDQTKIQSNIAAALIHELFIGSLYLNQRLRENSEQSNRDNQIENPLKNKSTSFASIEEKLLNLGLGEKQNGFPLIEYYEVVKIIRNHLTTLNLVMNNNNSVLHDELSHSNSLKTFFSLLSIPSPDVQNLVLSIMLKILPASDPEIVEAAVPDEWRKKLSEYDNVLTKWKCMNRKGRRPDSIIRILLLDSTQMIPSSKTLITEKSFSHSFAQKAFGYGNFVLRSTQLKFKLLQKLFETSSWTELVAFNVGNAFKNALTIISNKELSQEMRGGVSDSLGIEMILTYALSACGALKTIPVLIPGSRVKVSNLMATVIGGFDVGPMVDIVFDSNLTDFHCSKHVDTIEREKLHLKLDICSVDFSSVSQPVLPHLLLLTKELLSWSLTMTKQSNPSSKNDSYSRLKLMALGMLLPTILSLIKSQSEVVMESLLDTNIMKELIQFSSNPVKLPSLINFKDIFELWLFVQARTLERVFIPPSPQSPAISLPTLSRQPSAASDKTVPGGTITEGEPLFESDELESKCVTISASKRREMDPVVTELSEEFALPREFCQICLEYAMYDVALTKTILASANTKDFEDFDAAVQNNPKPTATVEVSEDSLFKGIEHAQSITDDTAASSILHYFKLDNMENYKLTSKTDETDTDLYVMEVTEEGLIKYNFQPIGISNESDLINKTVEPLKKEGAEAKVSEKTLFNEVMTRFYDHNYGMIFYKLIARNNSSNVLSFHHPFLPIDFKTSSQYHINLSLAILSARNLLKKLIVSGYSDILSSQIPNNNGISALSLVKLISSTDSVNISSSLTTICEAIPKKLKNSDDNLVNEFAKEETVIADLIIDAEKQLLESSKINLNDKDTTAALTSDSSKSKEEKKEKEFFRVSSPHPFTSPYVSSGEIVIPKTWSGATITFHPKCRTPSEKASLNFYTSRESLEEGTPVYTFSGAPGSMKCFKEITFNNVSSVFYKFIAEEESHKTAMKIKPFSGNTSFEESSKSWKIVQRGTGEAPVGLGEDDSLFNLFNDEPEPDPTTRHFATIIPETIGAGPGSWMFEVTIRKKTEVFNPEQELLRIGIMTKEQQQSTTLPDGFILGNTNSSWALGSDFAIYSNALVADPSSDATVFDWTKDVKISCSFEIKDTTVTLSYCVAGVDRERAFSFDLPKDKTIVPAVTFSNGYEVSMNCGENSFASSSSKISSSKPFMDAIGEEKKKESAWGYDFIVKPVLNLNLQLHRDFELIWQPKGEDASSGGASNRNDFSKKVWIWRLKASKDCMSLSDIVTTSPFPPRRALLVDKSQCKHPKSFSLVFFSSKCGLAIWRANPPEGYVAIGDVASQSQSPPSTTGFICLPKWAVKKCDVSQLMTVIRKVGEGKLLTNASIWKSDTEYGYFFGSPYEKRESKAPKYGDFKCDGLGEGYTLTVDIDSLVLAEWKRESDILTVPSLTWSVQLLHSLINSDKWKSLVVNDRVFKALINYLKSPISASPLEVIPTLILMVRQANKNHISLSFHEMKSLCNMILKAAVDMIKVQKKSEISKALMKLVDLVVEIQIVNVVESSIKDRKTISRSILKGKSRLEWFDLHKSPSGGAFTEEKEETEVIESKEEDSEKAVALPENVKDPKLKWWNRSNLVDTSLYSFHRLMKRENLANLAEPSEGILMKLKQVLKFLYAISSTPPPPIKSSSSSSKDSNNIYNILERSFPKLMTSRIWFEHISLCQFVQSSQHPYKEKSNFVKKIFFPGVQQLSVYFDKRCSLNSGDKLTISNGSLSFVLTNPMSENYLKKPIEFLSNEITMTFEKKPPVASEEGKEEVKLPEEEWGWAFIVVTSGPAYESAESHVDLEQLLEEKNTLLHAKADISSSSSKERTTTTTEEEEKVEDYSQFSTEQCVEVLRATLQEMMDKSPPPATPSTSSLPLPPPPPPSILNPKKDKITFLTELEKLIKAKKSSSSSSGLLEATPPPSLPKKTASSSSGKDDSDSDESEAPSALEVSSQPATPIGTIPPASPSVALTAPGEATITVSLAEGDREMMEVGIDSTELYQTETASSAPGGGGDGEERFDFPRRPQTKRGKRVKIDLNVKDMEDGSNPKEKKSSDNSTPGTPVKDNEKADETAIQDPVMNIIGKFGQLIQKDSISVPHAKELEVKIERATAANSKENEGSTTAFKTTEYTYLVKVMGINQIVHQVTVISNQTSPVIQLTGSVANYEIYCILTERLNVIHEAYLAAQKKREEAEKAAAIAANPPDTTAESEKSSKKEKAAEEEGKSSAEQEEDKNKSLMEELDKQFKEMTSLEGGTAAAAAAIPIPTTTDSSSSFFFPVVEEEENLNSWSCAICTLMNPVDRTVCEACGAPNPNPPTISLSGSSSHHHLPAEPGSGTGGDGGESGEGPGGVGGGLIFGDIPGADAAPMAGWWCPVCTLINPLRSETCAACGTNRPAGEEKKDEDEDEEEEDEDENDDAETKDEDEEDARMRAVIESEDDDGEEEEEEEEEEDDDDIDGHHRTTRRRRKAKKKKKKTHSKDKKTPSEADLAAAKASSAVKPTGDIIKITAKGKFDVYSRFEARLESALVSEGRTLTPLQVHHRLSSWTRECDDALLEYLNNRKDSSSSSSSKNASQPFSVILPKPFLLYQGQSLNRLTMLDIIMRSQIIELFNKNLETLLPLIDLSNDDSFSLGAMIRKSNRYLLMKIKTPLLEKAITATAVTTSGNINGTEVPATLQLDNYKSLNSREKNEKDPLTSQNCFIQAFKQLQKKDAAIYRYIISGDRAFTISFADESGIDAGGVFREGISRIIEDLFSHEYFNLLILSPNGQQTVHAGMDKFLPNPKHNTPMTLEMFEFIGKLMSMSVRAKLYLPFEFPPLIWKKIVGEEVNKYDLMEIDMITCKQLDEIENCHKIIPNPTSSTTASNSATATTPASTTTTTTDIDQQPITTQELFYLKYQGKLKFVYLSLDLVEKELMLNGAQKEVTFENRFEYVELVRKAKVNEYDLQIQSIVKGMGQVIPMRALLLFSAKQLEELVCGNPKIDMEIWKQNTESSGLSANTVKLFWKVMESLTAQEQTGFVRFAWGRSRLPSKSEEFQTKMRLTSGGRAALPVSHTCFFSVELPEYKTEEEMRHGLLTAIHYGVGGILNG
jgi:hypothetical protein